MCVMHQLPRRVKIFSSLLSVLLLISAIFVFVLNDMKKSILIPVNKIVSTGARVIVIRIPKQNDMISEDITVYDANMSPPYLVTRMLSVDLTPKNELPTISKISLTESQWRAIDAIRQSWCKFPPIRHEKMKEAYLYTIGVRCPLRENLFNSILLEIPYDTLPNELNELIQHVPPIQ